MPYLDDICLALIRVLESAAFHKDRIRLAGYRANIDFWASEIRHALDCLEGYEGRFEKLKQAREAVAEKSGQEPEGSKTRRTMSPDDIGRLRDRLLAASARFMRLCAPDDKAEEYEVLLGVRIRERRPRLD